MLRPFTKIKTDMQKMVQDGIYSLGILIEPKEFTKFSNVEGKIVKSKYQVHGRKLSGIQM